MLVRSLILLFCSSREGLQTVLWLVYQHVEGTPNRYQSCMTKHASMSRRVAVEEQTILHLTRS